MDVTPNFGFAVAGLCIGFLAVGHANAATISYSGTLASDDQVQLYSYNLAQSSNVVFATDSYGGGVTNGVTVPAGGFVPILTLFNAGGVEIGSDGGDATCSGAMQADPTTHLCNDASLTASLTAGAYTLAVTEFYNEPVGPNLSNGFMEAGMGNFTGPTCSATGGFYETDIAPCVQRTDAFSVSATTTPEPSNLWLGIVPMILFGVFKRRQSATQN